MSVYSSGTGNHLILIRSFSGLPVVQWYVISHSSPFPPCLISADWPLCSAVDLRPENRRESAQPLWILSLYHSRQNTIGHLYSVSLWAPLHTNQALKIDASGARTFTGNTIWLQSFTFTGNEMNYNIKTNKQPLVFTANVCKSVGARGTLGNIWNSGNCVITQMC